ncbi:dihydrofolate reductase [Treponema sp.]|uniref:dihydrofolate reductase n=1 Tax=Treponema sp. TaxID=166 RepID=UPI003F0BF291
MNIIYASGINGEFAMADGTLPWKNSPLLSEECRTDMDFFRKTTCGKTVIMGFNTFKTLSAPLKNRINIVIKRGAPCAQILRSDREFQFFPSLEAALKAADFLCPDEIFLIGGQKIIAEAFEKNLADGIIYETVFDSEFPEAAFFIKRPETLRLVHSKKEGHLTFNEYKNQAAPKA